MNGDNRIKPARFPGKTFPGKALPEKTLLIAAGLLACLLASPPAPQTRAAEDAGDSCADLFGLMYWTHRDEGVYRACRDGSEIKLLVPIKNADGLAVDERGGKLYFTISVYPELNSDKLFRANIDGSGVEELAQGLNFTGDLVLDAQEGKLYISSLGDGKIIQCKFDGSERKDWRTGLSHSDELAIDARNRKLYWVNGGKLQRADLDGSGVEDLATLNAGAMGMALDVENKRMHYATRDEGAIRRVNLDGTGDQPVVSDHPGVDGVAYDAYNRKLYWTESQKICQANEDGSEIETIVADKTHRFASIVISQPNVAP